DPSISFLPSRLMAHMLADVYGYTITEPAQFGTFHAMLQNNGELLIRGGPAVGLGHLPSNDSIQISSVGPNINVDLDLGNNVPGTGISGSMHSSFLASQVSSIRIQAGDGKDTIVVRDLPVSVTSINIDAGNGDDIIDLNSLPGISVSVAGGTGSNRLRVNDGSLTADFLTYNVNNTAITRSDGLVVNYTNVNKLLQLNTGSGKDTID